MIYVTGMNHTSIDSLIKTKYCDKSGVDGFEYMQKIVQLPFQIPTWNIQDITKLVEKVVDKGLEGSDLAAMFKDNQKIIVHAVKENPGEIKRFINR